MQCNGKFTKQQKNQAVARMADCTAWQFVKHYRFFMGTERVGNEGIR